MLLEFTKDVIFMSLDQRKTNRLLFKDNVICICRCVDMHIVLSVKICCVIDAQPGKIPQIITTVTAILNNTLQTLTMSKVTEMVFNLKLQ